MDRVDGAALGKEQLSSRRRIGSLPELRNVKTMPSVSPIPLTSMTGHGLAYASDTASKHIATAIIFVFVRTLKGSESQKTQPKQQPGAPSLRALCARIGFHGRIDFRSLPTTNDRGIEDYTRYPGGLIPLSRK